MWASISQFLASTQFLSRFLASERCSQHLPIFHTKDCVRFPVTPSSMQPTLRHNWQQIDNVSLVLQPR